MTRRNDKHIDNQELNALVPTYSNAGSAFQGLSREAIENATLHVRNCAECKEKMSRYRYLVNRSSSSLPVAVPGRNCPGNDDVDWFEVAAGLWPMLKASQLIRHAALCDYCGPRLRAATLLCNTDPTPQEEILLAELKMPSRPHSVASPSWLLPSQRWFIRWIAPAMIMALILLGVIAMKTHRPPLSGPEFAEFAVHAHQQYVIGNTGLDVRSNSQKSLNEWLSQKLPFQVALPARPPAPGEARPFRIEGARLIYTVGKSSAFIAYQMDTGPATLIISPETVAVASGGVEANFKRVSFHYATVEGYKVVTWTQHGRSYALVSNEGNSSQKSCMVCHSAMKDRDLTNTPTPLIHSIMQ